MNRSLRPKRRKRTLGCLLAVGIVLTCVLGVVQLANWWEGVIFPGTQFFYTNSSTHPKIFRLSLDNANHVLRLRIPPDYVSVLIPGEHWWSGYDIIKITAYLPDMVPEQVYDTRDPLASKPYEPYPQEQRLKQVEISMSGSYDAPGDPTGVIGYVTDSVLYAEQHEIPLHENPYSGYDAYLFTDQMPQTLSDEENTETHYVPRNDKTYYISCWGMPVSESWCDILFVYNGKIAVDVGITSGNIPIAETIIKKVSVFLGQIIDSHTK